jgi:tetratricopeptide (TPR) repeat protein
MVFRLALLAILIAVPAWAQRNTPLVDRPDQARRYNECMAQARNDPLRALPTAEKWVTEGGGMGARHCVATAMYQTGRYAQAAAQFEAIARDMGGERPGLRAELWAQAGLAWLDSGAVDKAVQAQTRAIELKPGDAEVWLDRGLAYSAARDWRRAIADFDRAQQLRPSDIEILILRAAAWRNAGDPAKALADAQRALGIAPDHSEALLERGFALLARGDRPAATNDFNRVLKLVPPGSDAAHRADAGLRGELPKPPAAPAKP